MPGTERFQAFFLPASGWCSAGWYCVGVVSASGVVGAGWSASRGGAKGWYCAGVVAVGVVARPTLAYPPLAYLSTLIPRLLISRLLILRSRAARLLILRSVAARLLILRARRAARRRLAYPSIERAANAGCSVYSPLARFGKRASGKRPSGDRKQATAFPIVPHTEHPAIRARSRATERRSLK